MIEQFPDPRPTGGRRLGKWWVGAGLGLTLAARLAAHDPGLSTLQIERTANDGASFTLLMSAKDAATVAPGLDDSGDGAASAGEVYTHRAALTARWSELVRVTTADGEAVTWTDEAVIFDQEANDVVWRAATHALPAGHWTLRLPQLGLLPPGHRQFVSATDLEGHVVAEALLSVQHPVLDIAWSGVGGTTAGTGEGGGGVQDAGGGVATAPVAAPRGGRLAGFLRLGVEHILTGYDHLLFLAGLLIVCRSLRVALGVITSFTVAHSLTLGLAALDIFTLPSRWVEPMIAASIVVVGVENLLGRGTEPRARWVLTFCFGLIHGFGFASVLRDMGLGADGRGVAGPLFGFNAGVEIGQFAVAAVVLPVLVWARRSPRYETHVQPGLSLVVVALGLFWLLQRTLG